MRFEYFLTLLKNAQFIIGNSSCGIREAPVYGVPCINIGTRQMNRSSCNSIFDVVHKKDEILSYMKFLKNKQFDKTFEFGEGNATKLFFSALSSNNLWSIPIQKQFKD